MASIVVSGDTSGAVTIAAPAVAGTPTLTLPTTSGTILTTAGGQTVPFAAGSAASPSITFTGDTNTGIFSPAADTIGFSEGGVESMRIDSSGNVGIGNTPSGTSATGYRSLELGTTAGTGITAGNGDFYVPVNAYVAGGAWKYATTSTASLLNIQGGLFTWSNAGSGTAGNNISFSERMRITSVGRLAIGSTTTNYPLYVKLSGDSGDWFAKFENTQSNTPYGFYLQYPNAAPNGTASDFIYCADSTAQRLSVRSNGGIANYSANDVNLSDEREKTNIQLAGSYLDKICAIPVKTFNYIDQNLKEDGGLTLGVIAQDVQKVAPELVMESNWAAKDEPEKMRLSIYQTDLQYALMKCIQEQQAMIEELKARIETLEAK